MDGDPKKRLHSMSRQMRTEMRTAPRVPSPQGKTARFQPIAYHMSTASAAFLPGCSNLPNASCMEYVAEDLVSLEGQNPCKDKTKQNMEEKIRVNS